MLMSDIRETHSDHHAMSNGSFFRLCLRLWTK